MFIQFIQAKCTRRDEVRAMSQRWSEERAPKATGFLGATYGFTDDDKFIVVARFESREAAMANSSSPEQTQWWAEMEKLFDGPAEFHDSDDVTVMLEGGSDDAGFVQVMRGRTDDPDGLRAMAAEENEELRRARPEIIGGTLALEPDGAFTFTVAFTDEATARKGEATEMPAEQREQMDALMRDITYLDLHEPWFSSR